VNYPIGNYKSLYSNEISKLLFDSELYNIINNDYLFLNEIRKNNITNFKRILPTILDINKRYIFNGNTLLHEAVVNKNLEIDKLLIEKGINKYIKNNNGEDANDLNESRNKKENSNGVEYKIYNEIHELLK